MLLSRPPDKDLIKDSPPATPVLWGQRFLVSHYGLQCAVTRRPAAARADAAVGPLRQSPCG